MFDSTHNAHALPRSPAVGRHSPFVWLLLLAAVSSGGAASAQARPSRARLAPPAAHERSSRVSRSAPPAAAPLPAVATETPPPVVAEPAAMVSSPVETAPGSVPPPVSVPRLHASLRMSTGGLIVGKGVGGFLQVGVGLRFGIAMPTGWSFDWETVLSLGTSPPDVPTPQAYSVEYGSQDAALQLITGPVVRREIGHLYLDLGVTMDTTWSLLPDIAQLRLGGGLRGGVGYLGRRRHHEFGAGLGLIGERVGGLPIVWIGSVIEARY